MKLTIMIAVLLGVMLAPATAEGTGKENPSRRPGKISRPSDTGGSINLMRDSADWESVWDAETGIVATKVLSKHTCIIAKMGRSFFLPALLQGYKSPHFRPLPLRDNRFIISKIRLGSLIPYGKRVEALCKGIPSYFAYPAPGSNFLQQGVSCLNVEINGLPVYYCG